MLRSSSSRSCAASKCVPACSRPFISPRGVWRRLEARAEKATDLGRNGRFPAHRPLPLPRHALYPRWLPRDQCGRGRRGGCIVSAPLRGVKGTRGFSAVWAWAFWFGGLGTKKTVKWPFVVRRLVIALIVFGLFRRAQERPDWLVSRPRMCVRFASSVYASYFRYVITVHALGRPETALSSGSMRCACGGGYAVLLRQADTGVQDGARAARATARGIALVRNDCPDATHNTQWTVDTP